LIPEILREDPGQIAYHCLAPSISLLSLSDHPANIDIESSLLLTERSASSWDERILCLRAPRSFSYSCGQAKISVKSAFHPHLV
jgi:hypothetical protein